MTYDFTTLSPTDFEQLVADLLSKEWAVRLETFKVGRDLGIDMRHTRMVRGKRVTVVVQCKRYAPHKLGELMRALESEKGNLERLRPHRYIVATSVALSPVNKASICALLKPFLRIESDIYGHSEINALLRAYPEIEGAHFKLWISSTVVLERVLHARIFAQAAASIEATRHQASKLVVHAGLNRALDLLRDRHHVLIVGNPGIGKTTLARMVMCHYMRDDFEPVWITGCIDDAWTVLQSAGTSDRRFVVVYDDFLGRLQFNAKKLGKNEDLSLFALLDRVALLGNVRLVLTTREYILADAKRMHGVLHERARELVKYTLSLAEYTKRERAQMLFNHLYFSDLPDSRLMKLVKTRSYMDVLQHTHFNPRIIENVSTYANSRALNDDEYIEYVRREFDNPAKLWEQPFKQEISSLARQVLLVLWSLNGEALIETLELAVRNLNPTVAPEDFQLQFEEALRQLDGNFIATNRYPGMDRAVKNLIAEFQNPSVEEFVGQVAGSGPWLRRLVDGCVVFDQVSNLITYAQEHRELIDHSFWVTLRERARACEGRFSGGVVNLVTSGEKKSIRTWFEERRSSADVTKNLLMIEKEVSLKDERLEELRALVVTKNGWARHFEDMWAGHSPGAGIPELQEWVVVRSGWGRTISKLSQDCLLHTASTFLSGRAHTDIPTLNALAEACTVYSKALSKGVRELFLGAARTAAEEAFASQSDADTLRYDIAELNELQKRLKLDLDDEVNQLAELAGRQEPEFDDEVLELADDKRYGAPDAEEADVDLLFKGLADR